VVWRDNGRQHPTQINSGLGFGYANCGDFWNFVFAEIRVDRIRYVVLVIVAVDDVDDVDDDLLVFL